jgi:hypothetical protein
VIEPHPRILPPPFYSNPTYRGSKTRPPTVTVELSHLWLGAMTLGPTPRGPATFELEHALPTYTLSGAWNCRRVFPGVHPYVQRHTPPTIVAPAKQSDIVHHRVFPWLPLVADGPLFPQATLSVCGLSALSDEHGRLGVSNPEKSTHAVQHGPDLGGPPHTPWLSKYYHWRIYILQ